MTPLTHHDLLRFARPLVERGWQIDADSTRRDVRRIAFALRQPPADGGARRMTLLAVDEDMVELVRACARQVPGSPAHAAVSTLSARAPFDQLDALADAFDRIDDGEPGDAAEGSLLVRDLVLLPAQGPDAQLMLRGIEVLCPPLRLRVDASTTGGTPADVWLSHLDAPATSLRPTLASGAERPDLTAAALGALAALSAPGIANTPIRIADAHRFLAQLPDDLLAVAAPRWRVLRWQGDHWKAALALKGKERARWLERDAAAAQRSMQALMQAPGAWHAAHRRQRWRVFRRRLRPAAALLGILAVMPIAWLAVSRGGIELHPLLLGITPLLMVFMIALSAREIPVMEWPPRPRKLTLEPDPPDE